MNKNDRGIIKWQPFNSLINGKLVVNSLLLEREKINKPIISEEDQKKLESEIIEAYYTQNKILIQYYKNGYLLKTLTKIKKIDCAYKTIYLENNIKLFFKQIIKIKFG